MEQAALSQLRWRCRRGIKEMDILLLRFLEQALFDLNNEQQASFAALLEEADLDIYAWISGASEPPNDRYRPIIRRLQEVAAAPPPRNDLPQNDIPQNNIP